VEEVPQGSYTLHL